MAATGCHVVLPSPRLHASALLTTGEAGFDAAGMTVVLVLASRLWFKVTLQPNSDGLQPNGDGLQPIGFPKGWKT